MCYFVYWFTHYESTCKFLENVNTDFSCCGISHQYVVEDAATRKVSIYSMLLLFIQ